MSASLVGSEMCIRDRKGRQHQPCCSTPASSSDPATAQRQILGRATGGSSCLLYTSDAADDM
eukprot:14906242-Alexandrium_andersonii.AAC.1